MAAPEVLNSFRNSLISFKICAWIVTSRAVVGSSAISRAGCRTAPSRSSPAAASHQRAHEGQSSIRFSGSGNRTVISDSIAFFQSLVFFQFLMELRSIP